jgi:DNA mismatch endonuclease (patch repair protein)
MASVKRSGTGPEIRLRKALHRLGYRYRLNVKNLPGSPDLVFPKYKAVIFVHGCFWHSHGCKYSSVPKTRTDFWIEKFRANQRRDNRNIELLAEKGWRTLIVWECEIKKLNSVEKESMAISKWLKTE